MSRCFLSQSACLFLVVAAPTACSASAPAGGGGGQPSPSQATTATVVVRDFEFSPATVEVPAGGTVVWRFEGPSAHTSTSDPSSAVSWDSGLLSAEQTYSRQFDTAGSFSYHCSPHPFMRGTVIVR